MTEEYYIYLTERQGWLSATGTTSDVTQALVFTRRTAIEMARKHRDLNGNPAALPVNSNDLSEVRK